MCGIVGRLNLAPQEPIAGDTLRQMLGTLRHRGPDGFGIYRDAQIGLGSARLSIIDLAGGQQPIGNEDGTLWIVFNGEIFNYVELRPELEARGHRFSTNSDTEVIVHLYEDYGPDCLQHLNGQFAVALWDSRAEQLFLARDRMGILPLFYTINQGRLIFGSEIKSLFAHPGVAAEIDPSALAQVFTFWSTLSPATVWRGIEQLPPAHYLLAGHGSWEVRRYWALDYTQEPPPSRSNADYLDEFSALLVSSARVRLRADVPVGAYLSGGLDSSITSAVIRNFASNHLATFSIAFHDEAFDESPFQEAMAAALGTDHHTIRCTHADIARVFPDVIWHTETPTLRTAPAPMYLLSGLVHDHGLKVVLTGEGADEILGGYDIFKEMKIRRFWAREPESQLRPLLLRRLYPEIKDLGSNGGAYLTAFFSRDLLDTASPFYSHSIRWANTARTRRFLQNGLSGPAGSAGEPWQSIPLPARFEEWSVLGQAQYLESSIFLSQYLLWSQGDRMSMAHSVEGRLPFLDHRLIEFCGRLPDRLKLRALTEKWLLREMGKSLLPAEIWQRRKRPYRAPIHRSFFHEGRPAYVDELLTPHAVGESNLFSAGAVGALAAKARAGGRLSEVEDMALAGILSTQLLYHNFVKARRSTLPAEPHATRVVEKIGAVA